ncbi:hypothetical protein P7K49_040258, partial [Saguinus oedipus]
VGIHDPILQLLLLEGECRHSGGPAELPLPSLQPQAQSLWHTRSPQDLKARTASHLAALTARAFSPDNAGACARPAADEREPDSNAGEPLGTCTPSRPARARAELDIELGKDTQPTHTAQAISAIPSRTCLTQEGSFPERSNTGHHRALFKDCDTQITAATFGPWMFQHSSHFRTTDVPAQQPL